MVSVIVPNYNHSKYLRQRIDSIINQTFQDFELILLDDKSSDNSVEILQSYSTNEHVSAIIANEENSGNTFNQWERGLSVAKGRYIWIAESDDAADIHFLERTVAEAEKDETIVICQAGANLIDENSKPLNGSSWDHWRKQDLGKTTVYDGKSFCENYMVYTNVLYNASGILFRRSVVTEIPNFVKQYRVCGDWVFWFHVAMQGKVAILHEKLNYYRRSCSSVSHNAPVIENLMAMQHFIKAGMLPNRGFKHCIVCGIHQRSIKHLKKRDAAKYHEVLQEFYRITGYRSMLPYHFSQFIKYLNYVFPICVFPSKHIL